MFHLVIKKINLVHIIVNISNALKFHFYFNWLDCIAQGFSVVGGSFSNNYRFNAQECQVDKIEGK
jgi:hypothetical protein